MAVLCPMHGEGSACPMMYKTLNVGQSKLFCFIFRLTLLFDITQKK